MSFFSNSHILVKEILIASQVGFIVDLFFRSQTKFIELVIIEE